MAAVAVLAACNRTAEEPLSHVTSATPSIPAPPPAASVNVSSDRCVVPTPDAPPPAPAPGPAAGCPRDPEPHPLQTVTVEFPAARDAGGPLRVRAELARRPKDSEKGLMYRTSMPEDAGMLFDLGTREVHTFWMHNTCIPLDMLFVDDDGLIVGIVEGAPTLNDAPRGVACPSTHVLEVNAGWSRRHGVRAGDRVLLPGA